MAVVPSQTSDAMITLKAIISQRSTLMAQAQTVAARLTEAHKVAAGSALSDYGVTSARFFATRTLRSRCLAVIGEYSGRVIAQSLTMHTRA